MARAAALRARSAPAIAVLEEQILVAVESEQRDRLELVIRVLAEEDRIFALHLLELGRKDQ